MENEIKRWLQSSREYYQGVTIYARYGYNRVLKQRFSTKSSTTQALLLTELCKLANITEDQAQKLPRKAKVNVVKEAPKVNYPDDVIIAYMNKLGITTDDLELTSKNDQFPENISKQGEGIINAYLDAKNIYIGLPETTQKTIKLREQFPFLSEDSCPDELKLLVHDMFTEYDKCRLAHKKLTEAPKNTEIEQLFIDAQTAVESYLSNRQIWEELEHYKEHGAVLGMHPKLSAYFYKREISELDDATLMQKRLNARSNVSRAKKEDVLKAWTVKLSVIEKEIDKRKK